VCFEASVDVQATLPTGRQDLIEAEARELVEKWAVPQGGLIAVEYRELEAIGAKKESLEWALQAFQTYGKLSG
jgi:hypothetical protein